MITRSMSEVKYIVFSMIFVRQELQFTLLFHLVIMKMESMIQLVAIVPRMTKHQVRVLILLPNQNFH